MHTLIRKSCYSIIFLKSKSCNSIKSSIRLTHCFFNQTKIWRRICNFVYNISTCIMEATGLTHFVTILTHKEMVSSSLVSIIKDWIWLRLPSLSSSSIKGIENIMRLHLDLKTILQNVYENFVKFRKGETIFFSNVNQELKCE